MLIKMNKMMKNEKGFTLIELLVVIAILGILAAVITPRIINAVSNAKTSTASTIQATVQDALERYYIDKSGYPTLSSTDTSATVKSTLDNALRQNSPQYLKEDLTSTAYSSYTFKWDPTTNTVTVTNP